MLDFQRLKSLNFNEFFDNFSTILKDSRFKLLVLEKRESERLFMQN